MNRVIKQSIKNLGANKTEQAICKVGKAVGVITPILDNFDEANCVAQVSRTHCIPNTKRDIALLLKDLSLVFCKGPHYVHKSFPKPRDPLHVKSHDDLKQWILAHI